MIETDVAIIGAGPIGLELAVACKRAGLDYLQFDKRQIGQTIFWFPPQTRFFSSPERIALAGVPLQTADQSKATREEYLAYLRALVLQFDLDVRTYERVLAIERDGAGFTIRTQRAGADHAYRARRVVLSTGGTARPRPIGVPGEDLPHVSHYLHDVHTYFRQRLLVVGGKNSAIEAALRAWHAGAEVMLSYRRETFDPGAIKYWLLPEIQSLIQAGHVRGLLGTNVQAIGPERVTLAPTGGGEPFDVPADFVLLMTGYVADMALFRSAGVELVGPQQHPRVDLHTMATNVENLYAIGTAVAGTQQDYGVFIENCHVHVDRVMASLTGQAPPPPPPPNARPEE